MKNETVIIGRDELRRIFTAYPEFDDCPLFVEVVAWPKPKNGDNPLPIEKHAIIKKLQVAHK